MNDPIQLLQDIQRLLELKGANPFKVRAYEKAAHQLAGRTDLVERAQQGTLTEIEGIGKSIAEVLTEFLLEGRSSLLNELDQSLPEGLPELTRIPGLGPKKAEIVMKELGIRSVAELEYACKENRLLKLKGFGPKAQEKIMEGIQFFQANRGLQRYVDTLELAQTVHEFLSKITEESTRLKRVYETGAFRRRLETLSQLDFLIVFPKDSKQSQYKEAILTKLDQWKKKNKISFRVSLNFSSKTALGYEWARTTSSVEHWSALGNPAPFDCDSEEEFYQKLGLPWISPELRETGEEVAYARSGWLGQLLQWNGIRGIFHNHTVRSDGSATLEEMVSASQKAGYEYIGISDHSQSAFYAQGLKPDRLEEQALEVKRVQKKFPNIRIFWGIESDILADGSLDYEPAILKKFDFVIASIHSRFQMDQETMTQRVMHAIRNPCTRFLGHPTGRLILGRKGYEIDMERILSEAAEHHVAVEINANPARLDIDWRWGRSMRKKRVFTSVNPDAHETRGIDDTLHGITLARKALIPAVQVVNSKSVSEVEKWLKRGE